MIFARPSMILFSFLLLFALMPLYTAYPWLLIIASNQEEVDENPTAPSAHLLDTP